MSERSIGILGGTFDPIHYGHLNIATESLKQLHLDKILFVPNGQPAHKTLMQVSDAEDRFEMTRLAIEGNPKFAISRIEVDRHGLSFAVDTLIGLQDTYPLAKFWFITGTDTIVEVPTWHDFSRLVTLCGFVVAARPGLEVDAAISSLPQTLAGVTQLVHVNPMQNSSTEIRNLVRNGESIIGLVPEQVEMYIQQNGLYLGR